MLKCARTSPSFPSRRDVFGNKVESVVGVKKETFDGSILSTEVGGSFSRFEFGQMIPGQDPVETGGGAIVRSRLEMPFFGSRRRQDRIIAQAFQESTARKGAAGLPEELPGRLPPPPSITTTRQYYHRLIDAYERYAGALDALIVDERVRIADRPRLESVRGGAETTLNIYRTRFTEDLQIVRSYVALAPTENVQLDVPEYRLSPLAEHADDPNKVHALLQKARENNPAFAVLRDAKSNAELQRQRAIKGRYDVTAFLEGTLYPVGSVTFDDRFEGWTVGGGVNVRLNDRRVLGHHPAQGRGRDSPVRSGDRGRGIAGAPADHHRRRDCWRTTATGPRSSRSSARRTRSSAPGCPTTSPAASTSTS